MTNIEDQQKLLQAITLAKFCGVKPRMMNALLTHFENLERIFNSNAGTLMTISGMTTQAANKIADAPKRYSKAEKFFTKMNEQDINLISRFETGYPDHLFELNDPPTFLYYRGELPSPKIKLAAIAGSEQPSNEGIELTTTLCKKLVELKVNVLGSLESGINGAAHLGANSNGGKSFAFLKSGFNHITPDENRPLAIDIAKTGGLLTEFAPDIKPKVKSYKNTNRLIVGASDAVILTEFYGDSPIVMDLLTCCAEIGKLVFILIDPKNGALTDEKALSQAVSFGAIPLVGLDKIEDIVKAMV